MPIQDGQLKEKNYKGLEIEGYDNMKRRFVRASISNHPVSDITFWLGAYDAKTKTITYDSANELAPGMKEKRRERFIVVDRDHYTKEIYAERNGVYVKATEVNCTRQ